MNGNPNNNLRLALLDQKVEGVFAGKPHAYTAVINESGWGLGIAVANEQGYHPIDGLNCEDDSDAREYAKSMNRHIGLSDEEATRIIISTMGGKPYQETSGGKQ